MRHFALLSIAILTSLLAACADAPAPSNDRSASQRHNADRNQSELSREIDKVKD